MFRGIKDFITGWRYVTIPDEDRSAAMDLLYRRGITFRHDRRVSGGVRVILRRKQAERFMHFADDCGIVYEASEVHGLAVVLDFMKKRPMIPLGFLLASVWIYYSTRIVWDIRIEGNSKTPDSQIIEVLDSLGFGIGTYFPDTDFDDLHAKYAAVQHDIAWLSIYMNGTAAEVQVRELFADERELHPEGVFANIVAECSGVVEEVNVFEGQAAVKAGDTVRAGQVLISGVVEKKDGGVRLEYASGEVICRTAVPLSAEVKTEKEKKVFTGREMSEKTVKIFKKSINLFGKGGIVYTSYDKISTMEQLCPFDLVKLPVWIENTTYRETDTAWETISADDAAAEALSELNGKIRAETENAELLSREVRTEFKDGVYRLSCLLTLRKDIGRCAEFTAGEADAQ